MFKDLPKHAKQTNKQTNKLTLTFTQIKAETETFTAFNILLTNQTNVMKIFYQRMYPYYTVLEIHFRSIKSTANPRISRNFKQAKSY